MPACKITALETMSSQDLADEYYHPAESPWPYFTKGQDLFEPYVEKPGNSCTRDWTDSFSRFKPLRSGDRFDSG
ncbi:MAG: hypothetical protein GY832_41020 [Chloroflexi bacterium]|nr:hypothetical protein [Chloroflexota bacterium]